MYTIYYYICSVRFNKLVSFIILLIIINHIVKMDKYASHYPTQPALLTSEEYVLCKINSGQSPIEFWAVPNELAPEIKNIEIQLATLNGELMKEVSFTYIITLLKLSHRAGNHEWLQFLIDDQLWHVFSAL